MIKILRGMKNWDAPNTDNTDLCCEKCGHCKCWNENVKAFVERHDSAYGFWCPECGSYIFYEAKSHQIINKE